MFQFIDDRFVLVRGAKSIAETNFRLYSGSKILIVDVDDTLRSTSGRRSLLPDTSSDSFISCKDKNSLFKDFNMASFTDIPLLSNIEMIKCLVDNLDIDLVIYLTSCTYYRGFTDEHLLSLLDFHGLNGFVFMRHESNQNDHVFYKEDFVDFLNSIGGGCSGFAVDDNEENLKMFQRKGFTPLKVYCNI